MPPLEGGLVFQFSECFRAISNPTLSDKGNDVISLSEVIYEVLSLSININIERQTRNQAALVIVQFTQQAARKFAEILSFYGKEKRLFSYAEFSQK